MTTASLTFDFLLFSSGFSQKRLAQSVVTWRWRQCC